MCRIANRPMTWEEARVQLYWLNWLYRAETWAMLLLIAMDGVFWFVQDWWMALSCGAGVGALYALRYLIGNEMDRIRGDYLLGQHPEMVLPKLDPDDLD